jgi:hypothetical protein
VQERPMAAIGNPALQRSRAWRAPTIAATSG